MASRHMSPSLGALRRSVTFELPFCPLRSFHSSTHRLEEPPSSNGGAAAAPSAFDTATRRARSQDTLKHFTNLQHRRNPNPTLHPANNLGVSPKGTPASTATTTPGVPPAGLRMVRAPSKLRITRDYGPAQTSDGAARAPSRAPLRGPNLRGRDGARRPSGARGDGGGNGPKRREKKKDGSDGGGESRRSMTVAETPAAATLSDGMVHNLLRLQRKEWDRVPYEPKYALGSFAANELIHLGRELFKGESPPIKVWGPLERRIGVVGMFGAEATLKVRRVLDGEAAPFGQEEAEAVDDEPSPTLKEKTPDAAVVQH